MQSKSKIWKRVGESVLVYTIEKDEGLEQMWEQFRKKNYFVGELEWEIVLQDVLRIIDVYVQ